MQRLFRDPEEEQADGDDHELFLRRLHGAERSPLGADGLVAARDFLRLRWQHLETDKIKEDRHDDGIRCGGNEPFRPGNRGAELLLDKAQRYHVLRCCRLDADIPDAGRLDGGDHEQRGEAAVLLHLESGNDAEDNRDDAADTRSSTRDKESQDETDEDHAGQDAVGLGTDLGENEKSDAPVKTRVHHSCCEKECGADEYRAVAGDAAKRHADGF